MLLYCHYCGQTRKILIILRKTEGRSIYECPRLDKCPVALHRCTCMWGNEWGATLHCPCGFRSLVKSLFLLPPSPVHHHHHPTLLPLPLCLVCATIVYSVLSRATGDTPKAKATVRGEIVGRWPAERDTGSILVWESRSASSGGQPWSSPFSCKLQLSLTYCHTYCVSCDTWKPHISSDSN